MTRRTKDLPRTLRDKDANCCSLALTFSNFQMILTHSALKTAGYLCNFCHKLDWTRPQNTQQVSGGPSLPQSVQKCGPTAADHPPQRRAQSSAGKRMGQRRAVTASHGSRKERCWRTCRLQHSKPITCMPTGSVPPEGCSAKPHGKHTAGRPARLRFTVIRSPADAVKSGASPCCLKNLLI